MTNNNNFDIIKITKRQGEKNMEFKSFRDNLAENFKSMADSSDRIYVTLAEPDKLYETYLNSFPAGTNNIFRARREHDCSACRSFIRVCQEHP